jgi:hypothetical protein
MKPFWDAVKQAECHPIDDIEKDVDRVAQLIESRVGRVGASAGGEEVRELVRKLVREILPYHLVLAWNGSRSEPPMNTIEYAALALGEDIRVSVKGDHRGRRSSV